MQIVKYVAWAWLIIIGGIMIVPVGPPICIACGVALTPTDYVYGIVSIALGILGLTSEFRAGGVAAR
jgi:hypothetical protein